MRRAVFWFAAMIAVGLSSAQDLPQTQLKVLGSLSTRSIYQDIEVLFWTKTLGNDSKGRITAEIKAFDDVGIKGPDLLKLTGKGIAQFASVPLSYYLTDQPINEAINIAGLATDAKSAKAITLAFEPVLAETYRGAYGVKLLGVAVSSPQLLFCRTPIQELAQLKGRKVRTSTGSQATFMQALGAKSTVLSMSEATKAFQDKSIDCAISSSMSAFKAGWYKWTRTVFAMPLGWNNQVYVVNQAVWDKFDPQVQVFISLELKRLVDQLWDYSATDNQKGIACLVGSKSCPVATKAKMILVNPSQADYAFAKNLSKQKVLPRWAKQCNESCVEDFNSTIGKAIGISVKR